MKNGKFKAYVSTYFQISILTCVLTLSLQSFSQAYDYPLNQHSQRSKDSVVNVQSTIVQVHPTVVCFIRQSNGSEVRMSENDYLALIKQRTHQNVSARCIEVANPGLPPGSMGGITRIYDENDLPRVMAQSSQCKIEIFGVVANSNSPTVSVVCEDQYIFIKKFERMNKSGIDAIIRGYALMYTSIDMEKQKASGQYRQAVCTDPDLEKAIAAAKAGSQFKTGRLTSLSCQVSTPR